MPRTLLRFLAVACALSAPPAPAQVRLGAGVHIGGHDVSHQTFDRRRRAEYFLYETQPFPAGCARRRNGDGFTTKVCRFKRLR